MEQTPAVVLFLPKTYSRVILLVLIVSFLALIFNLLTTERNEHLDVEPKPGTLLFVATEPTRSLYMEK